MKLRRYCILTFLLILTVGCIMVLQGLSPEKPSESPVPTKLSSDLRIILGGDIFVGERMHSRFQINGMDSNVRGISKINQKADLHFANLEAPITSWDTAGVDKQYHLRSSPTHTTKLLKKLNVNGVTLANNHILDYGSEGLFETIKYLERTQILHTGAGVHEERASKPIYFEKEGNKVGLVSFSNTFPRSFWATQDQPGAAYGSPEQVRRRVKEITRNADYAIVSFHWGNELDTRPKRYQRRLARLAVDSGADVVFGHHPHSIQPFEEYRDGLIFYSLGNYFFTTMSNDVDYGLMADITFRPKQKPEVRFHVLNINNYQVDYRPRVELSFKDARTLSQFFNRPNFYQIAYHARTKNDDR